MIPASRTSLYRGTATRHPQRGAITHLYAGVPVSDLDAGIDWYTRFFGCAEDFRAGDELLWEVDEHATLFIEPDAARAGSGRITFGVTGLDALVERLTARRRAQAGRDLRQRRPPRHIRDPDGNALAFAQAPGAAEG